MYSNIVVGSDGSDTAQQAVRHAAELAKITGAKLHIVTATSSVPTIVVPEMATVVGPDWAKSVEEAAQKALEKGASAAHGVGVEATLASMRGEPADALLDYVDQVKADLLVVGNKGMQGAKRFLLGSVPNRVAHHANCNVLIVHTA